MSGMIGSRQGWVEVPYLPCPCTQTELAAHLHRIDTPLLGAVHIVPGLAIAGPEKPPEVMRGEETQIIGALTTTAAKADPQLIVLPGTHSKWATVAHGAIMAFTTYMTGDVFAALRHHTILGRLMPEAPAAHNRSAFDQGVRAGATAGPPGALLHRIFATRTLALFDRLAPDARESYLSGLLIGAELATATAGTGGGPITVIGSARLSRSYLDAAAVLGLDAHAGQDDCAVRGHWAIARAAGLMKANP